jgi:hypothetical protein
MGEARPFDVDAAGSGQLGLANVLSSRYVRCRAITCEETTEASCEGGTCGLTNEDGRCGGFVRVEPGVSYEGVPHTKVGAVDSFFSQWTTAFKVLALRFWNRNMGLSQSLILRNKKVDVALIDRYFPIPRLEFTLFRKTSAAALGTWLFSRAFDFVGMASLTCNKDDIFEAFSRR